MIPRPWMKIRVKRQLCGCLRVCWLGTGDFRAGLTLGLEDLLDHDGHEAGVPVVGDEAHVLAVAKGKHHGRLERSLAEHGEALLVVGIVGAVGLAVELGASLAPNLGEEEGVVDEDAVDALLVLVEVADVVAERVDADGGIPGALVLVVAGRDGHDLVAALGELDGKGADDVAEASGLGPGGDLGGDEDDLHGAVGLGGVGRAGLSRRGGREVRGR